MSYSFFYEPIKISERARERERDGRNVAFVNKYNTLDRFISKDGKSGSFSSSSSFL